MTKHRNVLLRGAGIALVLNLAAAWAINAAPVSYTVDPAQSTIAISGNLLGLSIAEQKVGSLVTNYSGTVVGDLEAGILTFTGGSSIVAAINPGAPFLPAGPGDTTDNYGGQVGAISLAFFNGVLDFATGSIQDGLVPNMDLKFITLSFRSTLGDGDFDGEQGVNETELTASISTVGNIETIVVPIFRANPVEQGGVPIGSVDITGQIVATRVIPEPATWLLLTVAVGLGGAARIMRRKA